MFTYHMPKETKSKKQTYNDAVKPLHRHLYFFNIVHSLLSETKIHTIISKKLKFANLASFFDRGLPLCAIQMLKDHYKPAEASIVQIKACFSAVILSSSCIAVL